MSNAKSLHATAAKAIAKFKDANKAFQGSLAELHRQESRRAEVLAAAERQAGEAEQAARSWRDGIRTKARELLAGGKVAASPDRMRGQQAEAARDEAQAVAAELDALIAEQIEAVRLADAHRMACLFVAKQAVHQALTAELIETVDPILVQMIGLQRAANGCRAPSMTLPDLVGIDLKRRLADADFPSVVNGLELSAEPFDSSGDFEALFDRALNATV